ncbi:MAG TPA: hypothetical protein VFZ31_04405 [Vicinamibacterales bacterium]
MIHLRQGLAAVCFAFAASGVANAQEAPAFRAHQFTLGAGLVWSGAYDVGDATAALRGNGIGSSPPVFTLFSATSRVTPATSPELRIGYAVTPRATLEFGLAYTRPRIAVSIREDAEAPAQELPGETLEQYLIGGGVTWQLPIRMGSRLAPFALGGAAFLRQLHEDRTLAETGQIYYAGLGARYFLRGGRGAGGALGLRGDARLNVRRNGIDFEDQTRTYPTLSLAAFIGF